MKLCISTLVCPQWTLAQIVEAAKANGIAGIDFRGLGAEIDITKLAAFNEEMENTLKIFRENQLAIPCLNTSVTLVTPAAERWQMMLEEMQRTARLAKKTQTRFVRVFGGAVVSGLSREEALQLAQRRLRQLVKICGPSGCLPLVEMHDEWAKSQRMLELVHEFDPAEAGVLWDVEHSHRGGETPGETFAALKRFIGHVHFKDSLWVNGKNSARLMGEGDLPLKETYYALRDGGYVGWICLETEKRWQSDAPGPEVSVPQFVKFWGRLLGEDPALRSTSEPA